MLHTKPIVWRKPFSQPHLSASKYEVCMEVVSPPLSLHLFIVLRRSRFANDYWSRYGSLLVWGSNHYKFAHETTIGLPMDDYWFGCKRLLVYRSKDYSVSLPSVASSISTDGMFLCAVSHRASHRLEGWPLPAAGEGAPHRRRV